MDPVSTIQLVASTAALSKNISQWASEWVSESHRSLARRVYGAGSRESVYGLDVVNASDDDREHDVDICFVHGLRGDRRLTWKLGGDTDSGFWPKDLLVHDARIGRARVLTYGYDSDFPSFDYLTERTLYHQAQELLNELSRVRQKDGRRRLIFVCHTLGGILVQSALVIALASKDEAMKRIQRSVRGLIFLNTPYSGRLTDEEWSRAFRRLVHLAGPDMQESKFSSKKLKIMLDPFAVASSEIQIKELTASASKTGVSIRLRDQESSGSLQVDSDVDSEVYNLLGQVSGKQDPNYELLVQEIACICRKSRLPRERERKQDFLPKAGAPFFALDRDLPCRNDSRMDLAVQMGGSFGRWTEISSQHGLVVCLNGPAGAGKTQLALAYAHRKAEEFTSISWIAAENTQSIELGFYGIGNRLLKHYSSILSETWNLPEQSATRTAAEMLGLREVVQGPDFSIRHPTSQVSRIVTEAVRDWFNRADNTNWLLILDSMDAADLNECLSLLPTQRQNGLILITRRETWSPSPAMRARAVVEHISPAQNVRPYAAHTSVERFQETGASSAQKQGLGSRLDELSETEHKLLACCSLFPGEFIPIRFFSVNCQTLHILDGKYISGDVNDAISDVLSGLDGLITVREDLEDVIAEESQVSIWRNKLDPGVLKTMEKVVWPCMVSFASKLSKSPLSVAVTSLNQKRLVDMIKSYSNKEGAAPLQSLSTYDYLKLATLCLHRGSQDTAETVTDYARQRLSKPELHTEVSVRLLEMYIELKRTTKAESLFKRMHKNTTRTISFKTSFHRLEARMSELSGKVDETISLLRNIMMNQDQFGKNDSSQNASMWALDDLVNILIRNHNYEMAEPLLRRQLLTSEREYGLNSPAVISILDQLASVFLGQGRLEDAEDALLRVHQSNAARLGIDHPKTQACALELAGVHDQRGRHEKASELYTCALELYERWHGEAAHESLTVRMRRAECFEARQMLEEASSDYRAALEACDKAAGVEHKIYSERIDELKRMLTRYLPTLEDTINL